MKAQLITTAAALVLGAATASAQTSAQPVAQYDHVGVVGQSAPLHIYSQGRAMALNGGPSIGDGSSLPSQNQLLTQPGYSVGTGSAHLGDGSEPSYQAQQQQLVSGPGYSVGGSSAHVGGATDPRTQQELLSEPGYSVGTGSAQKSSK